MQEPEYHNLSLFPSHSQTPHADLAAPALLVVGYTVSWADLHIWLGVVGRRAAHAFLDLTSHGQESLLDIAGILGGRLEEGNSQAVGEFLWTPMSIPLLLLSTRLVRRTFAT